MFVAYAYGLIVGRAAGRIAGRSMADQEWSQVMF
jgi:hypothetical protein